MAAAEDIDGILGVLQDAFSDKEGLRRLLEAVIQIGMREEVTAHLGAGRHERSGERRGYRSGDKPRTLSTRARSRTPGSSRSFPTSRRHADSPGRGSAASPLTTWTAAALRAAPSTKPR